MTEYLLGIGGTAELQETRSSEYNRDSRQNVYVYKAVDSLFSSKLCVCAFHM